MIINARIFIQLILLIILGSKTYAQTQNLSEITDPKVIKEELDKCKSSTDKIYKRWSKGSELIEEEYTLLQGCYTNFSNQIIINERHNTLITNLLDLKKKLKMLRLLGD